MAKRKRKSRNTGVVPAEVGAGQRDDWEAKDALRTLTRGHEIMGNKGLMRRVKTHARKEQEAHSRVLRLEGKPL
jgi:hypothetical protein